MYIFNIILMDGKSTQFQRVSFDVFLKDKKSWVVLVPLTDKFSLFQKWESFDRLFSM